MLMEKAIELDSFRAGYELVEVKIDYQKDVRELIREMGTSFVLANLFDLDNLFQPGNLKYQPIQMVLISYQRIVGSDEVISDMIRHGIRPADIREFLFFCISKKWQIRGFDFVALGSRSKIKDIKDEECVPVYRPETFLSINQMRGRWPLYARFLGVLQTPLLDK